MIVSIPRCCLPLLSLIPYYQGLDAALLLGKGAAFSSSSSINGKDDNRSKHHTISAIMTTATTIQPSSLPNNVTEAGAAIRYNFWRGHPNDGLLPTKEMQQIMERMVLKTKAASTSEDDDDEEERLTRCLQYLKNDRGDPTLLRALQEFMDRHTNDDELPSSTRQGDPSDDDNKLSMENMFMTHGVSHGLDVLCATQTKPGDIVLVERPTYFLADSIFHSHRLRVQSLPMKKEKKEKGDDDDDDSGTILVVDVDSLGDQFQNCTSNKNNHENELPRMIYIIPTHQNPTGRTMSLQDRWKLCQLARRHGILVVADEVYHLLDWRGIKSRDTDQNNNNNGPRRRPARFSILDQLIVANQTTTTTTGDGFNSNYNRQRMGCSVSINSFTKIFAPGIRCGWIEGPEEVIDSVVDLGYIRSQGGCVPFVGEIIRVALQEGVQDEILQNLIVSYHHRCQVLCDTIENCCKGIDGETKVGIRINSRPLGGFFVWVDFLDLPQTQKDSDDDPASAFAKYCLTRGLKIMPGVRCDSVKQNYHSSRQPFDLCHYSARLCFADMDIKDVEEGARLLVKCYREYIPQWQQQQQ